MKLGFKLGVVFVIVGALNTALADEGVRGYYRSNGTYVQPSYRSSPDGNSYNNYSSQGNVNPYTGQQGERAPGYDQNEAGSSLYGENQSSNNGFKGNY